MVGSVVTNRVKSSKFPNTVSGGDLPEESVCPGKRRHLALILERGDRTRPATGQPVRC